MKCHCGAASHSTKLWSDVSNCNHRQFCLHQNAFICKQPPLHRLYLTIQYTVLCRWKSKFWLFNKFYSYTRSSYLFTNFSGLRNWPQDFTNSISTMIESPRYALRFFFNWKSIRRGKFVPDGSMHPEASSRCFLLWANEWTVIKVCPGTFQRAQWDIGWLFKCDMNFGMRFVQKLRHFRVTRYKKLSAAAVKQTNWSSDFYSYRILSLSDAFVSIDSEDEILTHAMKIINEV